MTLSATQSEYVSVMSRLLDKGKWRKTLSLSNMQQMARILYYPHDKFRTVHVAGSNGKGSVAWKTAAALRRAGYRVGLYSSPHLSCFRERIRINGQLIPEEAVAALLKRLYHLSEEQQLDPTFFELTTTLAFLYFAEMEVDVAVIEVGLGGRLDATNIITPQLSIITSISMEHTQYLGETLEEIAREKAGIIKKEVPVVFGPHTPGKLLQDLAAQKSSPCTLVTQAPQDFEEENRMVAKAALEILSREFHLKAHHVDWGLSQRPPCRLEEIQPSVILDVAHNPDGFTKLFKALRLRYPDKAIRSVVGLCEDKDYTQCLRIVSENCPHIHLVKCHPTRGVPPEMLHQHLIEKSCIEPSITSGVTHAQRLATENHELLLICGSFYLMREARAALGIHEPRDPEIFDEFHTWPIGGKK